MHAQIFVFVAYVHLTMLYGFIRLDTFDLQPHEIPIISFLPDDGSLKRGILTFGRISDGQDINEMMSPLFNAKVKYFRVK